MFALKNLVSRIIRHVIKKIKSTLRIINIKILKKNRLEKYFIDNNLFNHKCPEY